MTPRWTPEQLRTEAYYAEKGNNTQELAAMLRQAAEDAEEVARLTGHNAGCRCVPHDWAGDTLCSLRREKREERERHAVSLLQWQKAESERDEARAIAMRLHAALYPVPECETGHLADAATIAGWTT